MGKKGSATIMGGLASLACAAVAMLLIVAPASGAPVEGAASGSSAGTANEPAGLKYAKESDCFACHAIDHKVVGPAYDAVAKRYAGQGDAVIDKLVQKVIKGGSGNWGSIPMTPHPNLPPARVRTIVEWILSLNPAASGTKNPKRASTGKTYTYRTPAGKTISLDFPVFLSGQQKKVTHAVFMGYARFNSTCNRCHGDDAVGGAYAAPDLRHSLAGGMTWQQFLSTVMAGREAKGMPSWAGFYSQEEVRNIYEYVKARSVGLVAPGRPPSAQD